MIHKGLELRDILWIFKCVHSLAKHAGQYSRHGDINGMNILKDYNCHETGSESSLVISPPLDDLLRSPVTVLIAALCRGKNGPTLLIEL